MRRIFSFWRVWKGIPRAAPNLHVRRLLTRAGIGPTTANEIEYRKPAAIANDSLAVADHPNAIVQSFPKPFDRGIQIAAVHDRRGRSSSRTNSYARDRSQSTGQRASSQFSSGLGPFGGQIRQSLGRRPGKNDETLRRQLFGGHCRLSRRFRDYVPPSRRPNAHEHCAQR